MVTEILRPATVQEALKAKGLPGAMFLGGGTWLNARRHPEPVTLVSLERLGLSSIQADGRRCVLGATATFQQIMDHPGVPSSLKSAAGLTASRTLRNMMTIGGEVALHAADSALIPLLMAMEAEVGLAGKKKPVPFRDFLSGGAGALVLSVNIPEPGRPSAVLAVSRTSHGPRSLVVAASASAFRPAVKGLRIVVSDCRGTPVRLSKLEFSLEDQALPPRSAIEQIPLREISFAADIHASLAYKAYLARVLVADALHGARP